MGDDISDFVETFLFLVVFFDIYLKKLFTLREYASLYLDIRGNQKFFT